MKYTEVDDLDHISKFRMFLEVEREAPDAWPWTVFAVGPSVNQVYTTEFVEITIGEAEVSKGPGVCEGE